MPSNETLRAEASLCLWEAMLEDRHPIPDLDKIWTEQGTVTMRHYAIGLADEVLATWDLLTEDQQQDLIPYDWEFVPAFLKHVDWSTGRPIADPVQIAQKLVEGTP